MTYSRRNMVEEQQEARQKAKAITAACDQLHITLDPIDWQQCGMRAIVKVNTIEISSLLDLSQRDSDAVLRLIQIKLLEQAALQTIHTNSGLKALIWSPVEVIQPQAFLSLWIITLETDERIPIIETVKDGQRVYEPYQFNRDDAQQLTQLFGSPIEGTYLLGDQVTFKEHERQYTGEIIYIIPPGKSLASAGRKTISKGYHTIAGKTYTNEIASRYIVDCNDGFPHIVKQSQIIN